MPGRARDPNDRRYWPARKGGTGQGFRAAGQLKEDSRYHWGALNRSGSLSDSTRLDRVQPLSPVEYSKVVPRAEIRAKARAVTLASLDRLEQRVDSMETGELTAAANVAGKLAGLTQPKASQGVTLNIGRLHLEAFRAIKTARASISNGSADVAEAEVLQEADAPKSLPATDIGPETSSRE